ncbi:hypothetical protein FALCPG4_004006 [Fusarium falciforme]
MATTNFLVDLNKIIRSAYGSPTEYQELSFKAIGSWTSWNEEWAAGHDMPSDMSPKHQIFHNIGAISLNEGSVLPPFERATIEAMAKQGRASTQLATTNKSDLYKATQRGFNMDPFSGRANDSVVVGVLDSSGGYVVADKACRFVLHKARKFGARFILSPVTGAFESFIKGPRGEVLGIRTKDGKRHNAKLTIMACGPWTPSLVPQLDGLAEATAGSVVVFQIPKNSELFYPFAPGNFAVWMFKMRDGASGGLYGFPRDDDGYLKIGYRGTKYRNPKVQHDGKERSVPLTRWSDGDKLTEIPKQAMTVVKNFVTEYLSQLADAGLEVEFTRLCWYTDTPNNHFIVDRVPYTPGLMVASGGSGHAFKYIPNIGNWVVDIIEGVGVDRSAVKAWKWRETQGNTEPSNILMEGSKGGRALHNVQLTSARDKKLGDSPKL